LKTPPSFFQKFLRWFCHPELLKYIEGDLIELYDERYEKLGKRKADLKFIIDVLLLFRPGIIRPPKKYHSINNVPMFKNYFKIGWRNLVNNKGYSFINIGGLALGMAFAMVIGLWMQHELSFDSFHVNGDRLALVQKNTFFNNERNTQESTPYPLCDELKNNYPEVKRAAKVSYQNDFGLRAGENVINKSGRFVDPDFLEMFSFPLLRGDVKKVLQDPNSIVLTESLAAALFGEADPIGKTVKIDNRFDLQVTGIIKDVPQNST
jgi:putative ABC transport system permease protein